MAYMSIFIYIYYVHIIAIIAPLRITLRWIDSMVSYFSAMTRTEHLSYIVNRSLCET